MIEIKNGRAQIVPQGNRRVSFRERQAELEVARLLTSSTMQVVPYGHGLVVEEKDSQLHARVADPNEVRHLERGQSGRPVNTKEPTTGRKRAGNHTLRNVVAEKLTALLAEQVLGWKTTQDRFILNNRRWMPRWRFQPTKNLEDAFRLLKAAKPLEYALGVGRDGTYWVKVQTRRAAAKASGASLPLAICIAVARAYGIPVEDFVH